MKQLLAAIALCFIYALAQAAPFAYIANAGSNSVSVIDTVTDTVVKTIPVGATPDAVAVSRHGKRVYVANFGSNTVSVIDGASWTVIATIPVGTHPVAVAVDAFDERVLVANRTSKSATVIDAATNTVIGTVAFDGEPSAVDHYLPGEGYSAYRGSFLVTLWNASGIVKIPDHVLMSHAAAAGSGSPLRNIATLDTDFFTTSTIYDSVDRLGWALWEMPMGYGGADAGNQPMGLAIAPRINEVYVAASADNKVLVYDRYLSHLTEVPVGDSPMGVAATPSGNKVYVANYDADSVSVIDTHTHEVIATVPVGTEPLAMGHFIQRATRFVPDPFAFVPVKGTAMSTPFMPHVVVSNSIIVSGNDQPTEIGLNCPVGAPDPACEVSVNGGEWTPQAYNVSAGQSVRVRLTAAKTEKTTRTVTAIIGGRHAEFSVTTGAKGQSKAGG